MKTYIKRVVPLAIYLSLPLIGSSFESDTSLRDIFSQIKPDMFEIDPRYGRPDPDQFLFGPEDSVFKQSCVQKAENLRLLKIDQEAIAVGQDDIGTTGLVIDRSGSYYLKEDINFNPDPSGNATAAITINASKVTLFLDGHALIQQGFTDASDIPIYRGARKPSSQKPFVTGILISNVMQNSKDPQADGLHDIAIVGSGAIINGFSQYGIRISENSSRISVIDIAIKNCGTVASYYLHPESYYTREEPYGPAFGVGGMYVGDCRDLAVGSTHNRVDNLLIANVDCLNNFLYGLCMVNVTNWYLGNSTFDGTFSDDPRLCDPRAAFWDGDCFTGRYEIDGIVCSGTVCKW